MQHALENYHTKGFIPARNDEYIGRSILRRHFPRREPAGKVDLRSVRVELHREEP